MTFSLNPRNSQYSKFFTSIKSNCCPICDSNLRYDDQEDSVYISCKRNLNHFEVSGFKDLGSGKIVLIYLNDKREGLINENVLKKFQKIIYRKLLFVNDKEF